MNLRRTFAWVLAAPAALLPAQEFQFSVYRVREAASWLADTGEVRGGFAVGDLDRDGLPDVVVSATTSGTVMCGNGTRRALPVTLDSHRCTLRDLDRDGDLDLVFHAGSRPLQIVRNDGTALSAVALPPLPLNGGVSFGDADGDSDEDIVFCTSIGAQRTLTLLRQEAGLQFTLDSAVFAATAQTFPQFPALVDFDGDGATDVLSAVAVTGYRLWRNTGGAFVDATHLLPPTRPNATALEVGDLDGDGWTDVAAVVGADVDVFWGNGVSFIYQQRVGIQSGQQLLAPSDYDGDGRIDLMGWHGSGSWLAHNLGGRRFSWSQIVSAPILALGRGDIDGDRRDEALFTTTDRPGQVRVVTIGGGEWVDAALSAGASWPAGIVRAGVPACGDADGDGRTDLLIPTRSGLIVNHALGDGRYQPTVSPEPVTDGLGPAPLVADLDRDGDLDLVTATSGALRRFHNDGTGAFTRVQELLVGTAGTDCTQLGDIDGDGDPDIVHCTAGGIVLLQNVAAGMFALPVPLPNSAAPTTAIELADGDGDGDLDLFTGVVQATGTGNVVFANDGNGTFAVSSAMAIDLGLQPWQLAGADLDRDGDRDLVAVDSANGGLRLYRNDGTGRFLAAAAGTLPPVGLVNSDLLLADFDEDGDVDVFGVAAQLTFIGTRAFLLLNDGMGGFRNAFGQRIAPLVLANTTWRLFAGDADDDGDLDVFLGNAGLGIEPQAVFANNLRQLRTAAPARLGGIAEFTILHGPGFGTPGLGWLGLSFARAAAPLAIRGVAGRQQLDPASFAIAAIEPLSAVGVSSAFVQVPGALPLIGLEYWVQAAVLPVSGRPGVTNAIYERILR